MNLNLDADLARRMAAPGDVEAALEAAKAEYRRLAALGSEDKDWPVTGWFHCAEAAQQLDLIKEKAAEIRENAEVFVLVGVGGSNQAARALIEAVKKPGGPAIVYAGNTLSAHGVAEVLKAIEGKSVYIDVIAKNFETLEPGSHYRVLRAAMAKRYSKEEMAKRVILTGTVGSRLEEIAKENGCTFLHFPRRVGGRYSAFTPVALLPLAVAGLDVDAYLAGGLAMEEELAKTEGGLAAEYAAVRYALYRRGFQVEMLTAFEPRLFWAEQWWKQLFGESEGKEHKGIFPASAIFSTDLHSLGQYIQQGERSLFETVVTFAQPKRDLVIEATADNEDGLNFLAGKHMSEVNRKAFEGTVLAHTDGGVPNILLDVDKMDEYNLGWLIYFLEKACGISGYVLGVNPFDQPGVESYKLNMFALMGKPGYEERRAELENRINF